jgi:MATE family multidrug resistance protein
MVIVFTLVYALGGNAFLSLLTNDESVIAAANEYFWWAVAIPVAGVAAFIYDGIFIGMTATRGMLVSSAIASIVFFALFFVLRPLMFNHALWLSFIVYLAIRGLIQKIYLYKFIDFNCK